MSVNGAAYLKPGVLRKTITGPWKKWFAWHPVKVHGKRAWMKTVYRRKINMYVDTEGWSRYEYGTVFDVLTD
jgi:hypothetical protein